MKLLVVHVYDRIFRDVLNRQIKETGIQISACDSFLTYRQVCTLCKFATDGEHNIEYHDVHDFLDDVVTMWEHWNDSEPYSINTYPSNRPYMNFIG